MPLRESEEYGTGSLVDTLPKDDIVEKEKPELGAVVKAAFEMENFVVNVGSKMITDAFTSDEYDPDFNAFEEVKGTIYEDHLDAFMDVWNEDQFFMAQARIDREIKNRQTRDEAGGFGVVADLTAGFFDITTLLPGGAVVKGAKGTTSVLKTAGSATLAGLGSGVITEAGLQSAQETRTLEESAINIATETFLSGVLGGSIGALSKKSLRKAIDDTNTNLTSNSVEKMDEVSGEINEFARRANAGENIDEIQLSPEARKILGGGEEFTGRERFTGAGDDAFGDSAGAMRIRPTAEDVSDLSLKRGKAGLVIDASQKLTPNLRIATRNIEEAPELVSLIRETSQNLMETGGLAFNRNVKGVATPHSVELMREQYEGGLATLARGGKDNYIEYKKTAKERGKTPLRRDEFSEQVAYAQSAGGHEDPYIADTAKLLNEKVFEPVKNDAIREDMLPADVQPKYATGYFTRIMNKKKVTMHEKEFRGEIRPWATEKAEEAVEKFNKQSANRLNNIQNHIDDLEMQLLRTDQADDEIINNFFEKIERTLGEGELSDIAAKLKELPEGMTPENVIDLVKATRKKVKKPLTMTDAIVKRGGMRDDIGGELRSRDITNKKRVGIINNKNGKTLDDIALAMQEDGYFPHINPNDRVDIDEFLEAFDNDWRGNKVLNEEGIDTQLEIDILDQLEDRLDTLGFSKKTRVGDIRKITEGKLPPSEIHATIKRKIKDSIKESNKKAIKKNLDELKAKKKRAEGEIEVTKRNVFDVEEGNAKYIEGIVDHFTAQAKGTEGGTPVYKFEPISRGPLKNKSWDIPDYILNGSNSTSKINFLESDYMAVAESYTRSVGTDVQFKKVFGTTKFEDVEKGINARYNEISKKLSETSKGTPEKLAELEKYRADSLKDLGDMWDILRGTGNRADPDNVWVRGGRVIRAWNFMRLLGGMITSSAPDLSMQVAVHGFERFIGDAVVPLITHFKEFQKGVVEEIKLSHLMTNRDLHTRNMNLAELGNPYAKGTTFERYVKNVAAHFGKWTGIDFWNDFGQMIAGVLSQKRTLRGVEAYRKGNIKPKEIERLAKLGIDEHMADRIMDMFKKHGEKDGAMWVANTEKWTDGYARDVFRSSTRREVKMTIIEPGIGDIPTWMNTEVGATISQFKKFQTAAHTRVLIAGLQRGDREFLEGTIAMIGMGMMVYAYKLTERGQELSDDPRVWLREGIDRSGITGIIMEVNNMVEKAGIPGIGRLTGSGRATRFQSRSIADTFVGPSLGSIVNLFQVSNAISSGEVSRSDMHLIKKMLPYNNLSIFRGVLDRAVDGLADNMGKPKRRD